MSRRWSAATRAKMYSRHMQKRIFNSMWADQAHPQAAGGGRRCVDCAYHATCLRPRKGNHQTCFQRADTPNLEETANLSYALNFIEYGALIVFVLVYFSSCVGR